MAPAAEREGPAEKLLGEVLLGAWTVIERLARDAGDSYSFRTCCYRAVDKDGNIAFVKAFDFRQEERRGDTQRLEDMVREFNHERRVHEYCRDRKLGRVTKIFAAGSVVIEGEAVHFLVCEYAPRSLREALPPGDSQVPAPERLRALRKVASGISQLHSIGVAHQDIKPSNAVAYDDLEIKVTDLGSSSCSALPPAPHDELPFCGQPGYAPYELLYGDSGTWYRRRIGCDVFLLGNLAFTSFVGESLSYLLVHALPVELRHTTFTGGYDQVLPYLIDLHHEFVPTFVHAVAPVSIAAELSDLIVSMCHPDPAMRGHRTNVAAKVNQYGLERFISAFDRLARKCELEQKNVAA